MLAGRIQEMNDTLEARGRTLHQSLEQIAARGADVAEQAATAADRVALTVSQSGEALRAAIETSAEASVRSLTGANEKLREELPAVLDNLARTNRALEQIVGEAGANFASIEGALGNRIGEFRHSLETIFNQVAALGRTADAAVASAGSLSHRLEEQSRGLADAATVLAQTQLQLDASLATRQASLENLLTDVQGRTEGFDSAVRAFTEMVEDAFRSAEKRSRDIGLFLASETRNVAGLIGKQYEEVRSASEVERERTMESMREAYDAAVAEMSRSFAQTTERFRDTAEQMRAITGEIHRELNNTRDELRRGALELPKETSEQTAAMRRVIAEQIRALNELTDIVARSGRAFDVAEPMPVRAETPRAITARPSASRPAQQASPAPQPARSDAALPPAPRPERPAAPTPVTRAAPTEERGAGWLSDLLARASRDEAGGAQENDPVQDIARNISRYIDHESAVSVWDRYYRGDQNVFTRKIYSTQGQTAFDEARRRYRSERTFREAVDRFAESFEKDLQQIGREDRDGSMIRAYLTSESGKTYTLLAHAADRFEGA
jgi:hypothetical protein